MKINPNDLEHKPLEIFVEKYAHSSEGLDRKLKENLGMVEFKHYEKRRGIKANLILQYMKALQKNPIQPEIDNSILW